MWISLPIQVSTRTQKKCGTCFSSINKFDVISQLINQMEKTYNRKNMEQTYNRKNPPR